MEEEAVFECTCSKRFLSLFPRGALGEGESHPHSASLGHQVWALGVIAPVY